MLGKKSARGSGVAMALVVGALLACKDKSNNAPPPTPVPTTPVATGPCASGTSDDPGQGEFRPAQTAFKDKEYKTAIKLLDTMMTKYPNSSTVRVWRGDAALFETNVPDKKAADNAIPFYDEAQKIHDKGCKLPEYEEYYLRLGYTYAYLRKRKPEDAIKHLELAKKAWNNSAEVYYHLARAHCLNNDVDECVDYFEKALETAKALKRPKFLRSHHSLDDWVRRSRTQSEFPPLRKDPRYAKIIAKMTAEE
jgi:tetratricopeptide (TPR) repeat protein